MVLRPSRRTAGRPRPDSQGPLEIRPALPDDVPALRAVAARDSAPLPAGPLLLAEVAGIPIAAIAIETGDVVADPFWPTSAAVAALRDSAPAPRRRRGLRRPARARAATARRRLAG